VTYQPRSARPVVSSGTTLPVNRTSRHVVVNEGQLERGTAIAIDINRKDDICLSRHAPGGADGAALDLLNEHPKSVFWDVYSLGRLALITLANSPVIKDQEVDVDASVDGYTNFQLTRAVPEDTRLSQALASPAP
jgi:hypothetical protein